MNMVLVRFVQLKIQKQKEWKDIKKMGRAKLLTLRELAVALGVKKTRLEWWVNNGLIPYTQRRPGSKRFFSLAKAKRALTRIRNLKHQGYAMKAIKLNMGIKI